MIVLAKRDLSLTIKQATLKSAIEMQVLLGLAF